MELCFLNFFWNPEFIDWLKLYVAKMQENFFFEFPTKVDQNKSPQLHRLAHNMSRYDIFQTETNKGADQTAWMYRLICAFVFHTPQDRFSNFYVHV